MLGAGCPVITVTAYPGAQAAWGGDGDRPVETGFSTLALQPLQSLPTITPIQWCL